MRSDSGLSGQLFSVFVLVLLSCLFSQSLMAAPLDELRANGSIVERFDGYVQAKKNSSSVNAAVNEINAERRRIYQQRAASQGVKLADVGRVYAKQIFKSAPRGTHFLQENGKVVRK